MSQRDFVIPEVVIHKKLELPIEIPKGESISDELAKIILLEIQGEPVEISEEYPAPILMGAFDVIHKVSPELVLRLKSGKRILIFDHWSKPVIRDESIIIIDEGEYKLSEEFIPELTIEIEHVWGKFKAKDNDFSAIKKAFEEVKNLIRPSIISTIIGSAPSVLILLTQHLLYGKTAEIWYQENSLNKPVRIAKL